MQIRKWIAKQNPRIVACLLLIISIVSTITGFQLNAITTLDICLIAAVTLLSVVVLLTVKPKGEEVKDVHKQY